MFRKPKAKGAIRQRKTAEWEDEEENTQDSNKGDDIQNTAPVKVPEERIDKAPSSAATFSFDLDEGADSTFKLKKDKSKIDELKRQQKLEQQAEDFKEEKKRMEAERMESLEKMQKSNQKKRQDQDDKMNKKKYLEKYRDKTAVHVSSNYDDELEIDETLLDTTSTDHKFNITSSGIPDSRAVYEAKKRRERMRNEGNDGYIPLDRDDKIRSKSERGRLIREDDNDDSDEGEHGKFYSARDLLKTEEDIRKEEEYEFLNRENGNDDSNDLHDDDEMEEWERQQILKGASGRAIGRLKQEKIQTAKLFGHTTPVYNEGEEDMDIDMDTTVTRPSFSGPTNTGGVIKIEDILAKLKLKIQQNDESLNRRKEEIKKIEDNLGENTSILKKIEIDVPKMSTKYQMFQELRFYIRSLLECLNEKVVDINEICDKRREYRKARTTRLIERRRLDMKDQYAVCSANASGKNQPIGNSTERGRAVDRELRREKRRKLRAGTLPGISHEEGLSTDDEEAESIIYEENKIKGEIEAVASVMFADASEEFSSLRIVLTRMMDWLAVDEKSFKDAFVFLCLPKLCSPYVRFELITSDLLFSDTSIESMNWFNDAIFAGSENIELNQEHEIIVELVPKIVEKVVIPFLIDTIKDEWDPLSLSQTKRLAGLCKTFEKMANLNENSKTFMRLMEEIRFKIKDCIREDMFAPMFSPSALEVSSTGCRSFHDRQYWSAIKLIRSINSMKSIISLAARFEFVVEKVMNQTCVVSLRTGFRSDQFLESKIISLLNELDNNLLMMGGMTSFRQFIDTLNLIVKERNISSDSPLQKQIQQFLDRLKR